MKTITASIIFILCACVVLSIQIYILPLSSLKVHNRIKPNLNEVKVSVYYEALCPDSINFIKRQLYPAWTKLNGIFEVELIPYGKAIQNKVDGKWVFQCQHGHRECYGNKIQACALKQDIEFSKKMKFVNCLMSSSDPSDVKSADTCASENSITWEPIRACTDSAMGDDYLAEMGDQTHSLEPQVSFIPTITFNDTYDHTLQWESMKNLKKVVCRLMDNPSPCSA